MTFGYNVQYWSQLVCNKKPLPLRDKTLKSLLQQEMLFSIGKTMNTIIPTSK